VASGHSPSIFLGGNIGRSLLADLPRIRPTDIVVLELSSFMLEETPQVRSSRFSVSPDAPPKSPGWSPNIAVITNLFPNHLDRHVTIEAYAAAKQNILRFQGPADIAILNADHELVSGWDTLARGTVLKFTTAHLPHLDLVMPGIHNQSNARAALAVIDALATHPSVLSPQHSPLDRAAAHAAVLNFPGLAHRLQCVHTIDLPGATPPRRLRFFNDSKATSPQASVTALQTFDPGTAIFIIGGYDKHLPDAAFETFDRLLVLHAAAVLGIGATGPAMVARLQARASGSHTFRAESVGTLERAVQLGTQWAKELGAGALVLSPASASWDQFPNYEKRGDVFAELSRSLPTIQE
jgi:UDP-N-acetylmuramoylalanine--D-glutamate ligase